MIKNYFKIAFRNLIKNRTYSLINVVGLGLGLATGFIMLLWVNNEYSMNRYHNHADRIYQVNAKLKFGTDETVWENTPAPVAVFARENISDIEKVAMLKADYGAKQVVKYNTHVFVEDKIGYTENPLFEIFDLPIVSGNSKMPLAGGLSVVLTESTAKKYFGSDDPVGKILRFRDTIFSVSGVMKDFPANSSIQLNMLFSMDILRIKFRGNGRWKTIEQDWGNYNYSTYCLMKKGSHTNYASTAILAALKKANPQASIISFPFRPLKDIYLYKADGSKGRIIMVEIFFIIAIFVLLIACINYVNLVTAKATQRVKEISIRKIIGAEKKQLFWQFFIEAGVLLILASMAALFLTGLLLPVYKQVSGNDIAFNPADWQLWKVFLSILGVVWLLTGLYPALLLSSFKPLHSLQGRGLMSGAGILRKSLVVLQFIVSITLLLSTVFIHRQMSFIRNKDLHVNTDNVIVFPVWKIYKHTKEFKNELQQSSRISAVTSANMSFFEGTNSTTDLEWPGKEKGRDLVICQIDVDQQFLSFFHTAVKEGTDFSKTAADAPDYILNETAVRKMGLKDPVGQTIKFHDRPGTVIGVVQDFHFESLQKELQPALLEYAPGEGTVIYARVQQKDANEVIAFAQNTWRKYEPDLPMEYSFLDDQLARQYDKETRASYLFDAFSLITLFISCLGLFGLAAYSAERRTKEIGIRKVLGADIRQLASLLSKEFVLLVLIAIVVAVPVVWLGMGRLLNYFAYRISLDWWVFVLTCALAVLAAIVTVSFQAIKAALANPVKSLRTE
jgi:putative ABC transport system permease protein